ncbi:hypothetical protein WB307_48155, partial [Streptomyces brasiliscabiei]
MSRHGGDGVGFSRDPDRDFEIRTVIGHATAGAADIGEVLSATARIPLHDHEAWSSAWHELAA